VPKIAQPDQIKGKEIILRKLHISDAEAVYSKFHRPEILKWIFFQPPKNFNVNDQKEWIKKISVKIRKRKSYVFGIILPRQKDVIGIIGLEKFNWGNKNAQIGYWLAKDHWGKGLIPKAVHLILAFAFRKLKLHRVYAAVFADNIQSQKVLEKCGFIKEGLTRHATFRFNRWHDKIRYGILSHEFKNRK